MIKYITLLMAILFTVNIVLIAKFKIEQKVL
jgi:hypothetical protein